MSMNPRFKKIWEEAMKEVLGEDRWSRWDNWDTLDVDRDMPTEEETLRVMELTKEGFLAEKGIEASYTEPVTFTKTNQYGCGSGDDVYTVEEFAAHVRANTFIDYDGFGHPVKDKKLDPSITISPSQWPGCVPEDATHIVWYNK